jgi:NAD(P)-dependent dehydrogenase (short-subunit alcohol dehydrogenase family)
MPEKTPPKKQRLGQRQAIPSLESLMSPQPKAQAHEAGERLRAKVAIVTGADGGTGRAVAVAFAKEGADVAVVAPEDDEDAHETKRLVERERRRCLLFCGDVGEEQFCREVVQRTVNGLDRLDVLVNSAIDLHPQESILQISSEQLERTFRTTVFSCFFMSKAAIKHLDKGSCIINAASVTAFRGHARLLDYSAANGAIVAFTRSLALALADKGIRVNGIAPGLSWSPLMSAILAEGKPIEVESMVPMKRLCDPDEVAPCFIFLASSASSYMTGQFLHPNGGEVITG